MKKSMLVMIMMCVMCVFIQINVCLAAYESTVNKAKSAHIFGQTHIR